MNLHSALSTALLVLAFASPLGAQTRDDDPCANMGRDDDRYRHCEVREESMAAGPLTVDAGTNGGIRVEAWDQNSVRVQAVVQTTAGDEGRARALAQSVQLLVGGGRVSATGPERQRDESWSVSFRIDVPRQNDLDLKANNGGISIAGVSGTIKFDTNNGGVKLSDLGGSVHGETHNGGVMITLNGAGWDGQGLEVDTTNGGVTLAIPEGYNAQLETGTVNGGFRSDYPLALQGDLSSRRSVTATLGAGGAPIRVRTTNGGVKLTRR